MNVIQSKNIQIEEIDIPSQILGYLEKRTIRSNYYVKDRYSVTDIIGCQRKNHYKAKGVQEENLLNDATVLNMWDSVRGDLLHQLTYAYRWREMDIEYKVLLDGGERVATVVGRLDMYDWKTATIIDLKTTKFIKWQTKQGFIPKIEHILQLQCYGTMFSRVMPVNSLNIVYVDMNDIVAYKIEMRDLTKWIHMKVQQLEDALTNNVLPSGQVTALCKFCRYQTRCYDDGDGLSAKPLSIPKKDIDNPTTQ